MRKMTMSAKFIAGGVLMSAPLLTAARFSPLGSNLYSGVPEIARQVREQIQDRYSPTWALGGVYIVCKNLNGDVGFNKIAVEDLLKTRHGACADLRGAHLSHAALHKVDLTGANLFQANLREIVLDEVKLIGANLSGADLRGAFLVRTDLSRVDLSGANLSAASLRRVMFIKTDLRGANLSKADLSQANLSGADLRGANLGGAHLSEANLAGAVYNDKTILPFPINVVGVGRLKGMIEQD